MWSAKEKVMLKVSEEDELVKYIGGCWNEKWWMQLANDDVVLFCHHSPLKNSP